KMAFWHARTTRTTKPTCVKMFTSRWASKTPATEQSKHMGTTRITANGSDQLSYCAANTRNTSTTASRNTHMAVLPVWSCSSASSVHSVRIDSGNSRLDTSSRAAMAWPELVSGPASACTAADSYML